MSKEIIFTSVYIIEVLAEPNQSEEKKYSTLVLHVGERK